MILSCQQIQLSFGEKDVLRDISFHLEEQEKAALIGCNGVGKTTLLKILIRELAPDRGEVILARDTSVGYLAQYQQMQANHSIYEELMDEKRYLLEMEQKLRGLESAMQAAQGDYLAELMHQYTNLTQRFEQENGYALQSEVTGILIGLGFSREDFSRDVSSLSGGEKTRLSLGRLLLSHPDLLLLDEPTNHLDMESIAWLETYLRNYPSAVLLVSHDRYFLDRVVAKVMEIEDGFLTAYEGNYSEFQEKKAKVREAAYQAYLNQQQEIRHEEEVIEQLKSFNREKSLNRARSREKKLEKMEVLAKPQMQQDKMRMTMKPRIQSGRDVLAVDHLSKSFPNGNLFSDISFTVQRGEHVAIIGANGVGKTTLLKIINGLLQGDTGSVTLGTNVMIGYYDQEQQVLHDEKSIFDDISDAYPDLTRTQICHVLAAFLFTGDDVHQLIASLSGGERGRLSLAKLMLSEANFLILDEPTNHLDITSREILEEALNNYTGTLLYVSHDRYFINHTATRILDLSNQTLTSYIGNYDYYLEKREEREVHLTKAATSGKKQTAISENKRSWQQQKEELAAARRKKHALEQVEERIDQLELRNEEINELLGQDGISSDAAECADLCREQAGLQAELEQLLEEWEGLSLD